MYNFSKYVVSEPKTIVYNNVSANNSETNGQIDIFIGTFFADLNEIYKEDVHENFDFSLSF